MIEVRYIYDWQNKPVNEYTIKMGKYQFSAINLGAAITKIVVPNKFGKLENIILRYYDYKEYKSNPYLLGSLIDYNKFINNETCQLNYYFDCEFEPNTILFKYTNKEQYIKIKYSLLDNHLLIEYETNNDLLLSHVIYFNLSGNHKSDITNHLVYLNDEIIDVKGFKENVTHYEINAEKELLHMTLKENGIKVTLDALERKLSMSNGHSFKKQFLINKEETADLYSGIGVVTCGKKHKSYVNYEFDLI